MTLVAGGGGAAVGCVVWGWSGEGCSLMHESCRSCCLDDGDCRSLPDFSMSFRREGWVARAGPSAATAAPQARVLFAAQSAVLSSGVGMVGRAGEDGAEDTGGEAEPGAVVVGASVWDSSRKDADEESSGTKLASSCTGESGGVLAGEWCCWWCEPSCCPSDASAGPPCSSFSASFSSSSSPFSCTTRSAAACSPW